VSDLTDPPDFDHRQRLRAQRVRFALVMCYALPFILLPLVLGAMVLWRSLPAAEVLPLQRRADELRGRLTEPTGTKIELTLLANRIETLDRRIADAEQRRRQYVGSRAWAAAFSAIGLALVVAWTVALVKLMRKRELLEIRWQSPPPPPE
jgi:hypothetical protein